MQCAKFKSYKPYKVFNRIKCEQCIDGLLDTQEHIPLCNGLNKKVDINYKDLFSSNLDIAKEALIGFEVAWTERLEKV